MRKKRFAGILLGLALVAMIVPSAYAYMVHKSQTVENSFKPAWVECEIEETFDGSKKSSIKVKNTGNIEAYIRVRLGCYYEDTKGNAVARTMEEPDLTGKLGDGWKKIGDMYYYTEAVKSGMKTGEFLKEPLALAPVTEEQHEVTYTYNPVVEVLAEAIQSRPETTVKEVWGVTITDGKIQ